LGSNAKDILNFLNGISELLLYIILVLLEIFSKHYNLIYFGSTLFEVIEVYMVFNQQRSVVVIQLMKTKSRNNPAN